VRDAALDAVRQEAEAADSLHGFLLLQSMAGMNYRSQGLAKPLRAQHSKQQQLHLRVSIVRDKQAVHKAAYASDDTTLNVLHLSYVLTAKLQSVWAIIACPNAR
jgi:hypothetical protein